MPGRPPSELESPSAEPALRLCLGAAPKEVKETGRRTSPGTFVNLALDINSYLTFKTSPGGTCRIQIPTADSGNLHCLQKLHLLP